MRNLICRLGITPKSDYAKSRWPVTPFAVKLSVLLVVCSVALLVAYPHAPAASMAADEPSGVQMQENEYTEQPQRKVVPVVSVPDVPEAVVVSYVQEKPATKSVTTEEWLSSRMKNLGMGREDVRAIIEAASNNGCSSKERLALLLAIRKHENGGSGFEWGVVPARGRSYRVQAGWAAATISKFMNRKGYDNVSPSVINALALQYCPADRTSVWQRNVRYWYAKILAELNR